MNLAKGLKHGHPRKYEGLLCAFLRRSNECFYVNNKNDLISINAYVVCMQVDNIKIHLNSNKGNRWKLTEGSEYII